jgi:predicted nucleic acid-binding protein
MKKVVFDSYAFIAFFRQEEGYEQVRELLVKMANGETEGFITTVNVGEVYYLISRKSDAKNAAVALDALQKFPLIIVDADLKLTLDAAALKAKYALSYADAFAGALTIQKKATLITGDSEFENLKGEAGFFGPTFCIKAKGGK